MDEITILQMRDLTKNVLSADFYANTIPKHLISNHTHIEKPHKHNFYTCMIFTHGSGTHEIDFNSFEVKRGAIFMLAPGQTHSWDLSSDIDGYIFFHTQEFFDLFFVRETIREYPVFRSAIYPNGFVVEENEIDAIVYLMKQMVAEVQNSNWKKNNVLVNLASLFYVQANRMLLHEDSFKAVAKMNYSDHFQYFEDLLEKHFKHEKSAALYAEKMNITQRHLNRVCKSLVDKTTTDVILDRIVLEAKRMLLYTGYELHDIGEILGYEDYSYFSKVFKRKTGYNPKDFLRKYE